MSIIVSILLLLCTSGITAADSIVLNDGTKGLGTVLAVEKDHIVFVNEGNTQEVRIAKNLIYRYEKDGVTVTVNESQTDRGESEDSQRASGRNLPSSSRHEMPKNDDHAITNDVRHQVDLGRTIWRTGAITAAGGAIICIAGIAQMSSVFMTGDPTPGENMFTAGGIIFLSSGLIIGTGVIIHLNAIEKRDRANSSSRHEAMPQIAIMVNLGQIIFDMLK